jgi:hypothetical protein
VTEREHPEEAEETVNRESHPNSGGPEALSGDMGLSSERHGPFEGIEGMGSQSSTQGTTDGESPTDRAEESLDPELDPDKPDETLAISGVDRTVGEVQPDPVVNKHDFDPSKNPRH